MSTNPKYFKSLDSESQAYRGFHIVRGLAFIIIGLLILFLPNNLRDVIKLVLVLALLLDAFSNIWLVVRGKIVPHLKPQVYALIAFSLIAALVIIIFPAFALRLAIAVTAFLMFVRGVLALIAIGSGDEDTPVSSRRWLLLTAIVSFALAIFVFASRRSETDTFAIFLGLLAIWEGIERLRSANSVATAVKSIDELGFKRSATIDEVPKAGWVRPLDLGPGDRARYARVLDDGAVKPKADLSGERDYKSWMGIDLDKYQNPIIIAPHPDDLEGFTGGLCFKLKALVISVVMSGGNKGVWEERFQKMDVQDYMEVRLDESAEAARLLGVKGIIYMGMLDRGVVCNAESVARMLRVFDHVQPDLVVSFEWNKRITPYAHPDHIATAQVVRHAVAEYSKTHKVDYLLTSTFAPNRFVNVSGVRRAKLEALACHTTQSGLNGIIFPLFEKALTRLWGLFTNVQYAEGYRKVKLDELRNEVAAEPALT